MRGKSARTPLSPGVIYQQQLISEGLEGKQGIQVGYPKRLRKLFNLLF
jgi:hypothetical protein